MQGSSVLEEAERRAVIESLRWVDELIEDVPYDINPEFMRELYDKHNIDYIVHGDDPCLLPDGTDAYDAPKRAGRFKMIKRTEGISTTNIVEDVSTSPATKASEISARKSPLPPSPPPWRVTSAPPRVA